MNIKVKHVFIILLMCTVLFSKAQDSTKIYSHDFSLKASSRTYDFGSFVTESDPIFYLAEIFKSKVISFQYAFYYSSSFDIGCSYDVYMHQHEFLPKLWINQRVHLFAKRAFASKIDLYIPFSLNLNMYDKKLHSQNSLFGVGCTLKVYKNYSVMLEYKQMNWHLAKNPKFLEFGVNYNFNNKKE